MNGRPLTKRLIEAALRVGEINAREMAQVLRGRPSREQPFGLKEAYAELREAEEERDKKYLPQATESLASLLRATATAFVGVGESYNPATIHVYWKKSARGSLPYSKFSIKYRDGYNGFPLKHHFSGRPRPAKTR